MIHSVESRARRENGKGGRSRRPPTQLRDARPPGQRTGMALPCRDASQRAQSGRAQPLVVCA